MYQALYRKWRPRSFDDVVGQEHITGTLKKQVETGRLSHAYLFVGTRGTGKTTCAKILARAVNCEHPVNGNPCNECAACRGIESGGVLDVVELDAASNNGVDNVRALRDEAVFSPASVKKRVYIIDEVHMLSTSAFNALLKILEEPPEHLLFILCTTELRKVLPTIVSRCQRHSFKRLSPEDIAGRLRYVAAEEKMALDDDAAELLARLADGGMRDGLSLLDQCSAAEHIDTQAVLSAMGLAGSRRTAELLDAVCARDSEKTLALFDELWFAGKEPSGILSEVAALLRDVLLTQVAPKGCARLISGAYAMDTLRYFSKKLSGAELLAALDALERASSAGSDPRRAAELCLLGLCLPETGGSLLALSARVARLEKAAAEGGPAPAPRPAALQRETPPVPQPASPSAAPDGDYELPPPPDDDCCPPETAAPWDEPPADARRAAPKPAVPRQEPPPAPKPAAPKRPEAPPAPAPATDDAFWERFLQIAQSKLDVYIAALLLPAARTVGELRGDTLQISVSSPFARMTLERGDVAEILRREASALAGRSVLVTVTEQKAAPKEPDMGKLDSLSKFANFRTE